MKTILVLVMIFTTVFAASYLSTNALASNSTKGKEAPVDTGKEKTAEDKKAIRIFNAQGCRACHYKKTGMENKPYPSLPLMASRTFEEFKKSVLEGVEGTTMVAYKDKVSEDDIKLMYNLLTKFYKGK